MEYDSLVERVLATIIVGSQGSKDEQRASPQEVEQHPDRAQGHPVLTAEAIKQARLPVREEGLGLPSAVM